MRGQIRNKRLRDAPAGRVFFTSRRYASAVYAVETTERIELAFGTEASFYSTCYKKIRVFPKNGYFTLELCSILLSQKISPR